MTIEARLARLEDAHRALAAQHTALQITCRMMLPMIMADPATMRTRLLAAYDTNNQLMGEHGFDDAYQAEVRHWLDVLAGEIVAAAHTHPPRPSSGQ